MKTALILGATGLVGSHVLRELLARPDYKEVIAWARRPLDVTSPKLKVEIVDLLSPPATGARIDDVYSCLGTTIKKAGSQPAFREVDYEMPLRCARAAIARGATSIALVSSVGADARSKTFYLRTKGELEEALKELPFQTREFFQPSFLMGDRSEKRPGERIGITVFGAINPLLAGPLRRYRAIPGAQVAQAMVRTLLEGRVGTRVHEWTDIVGA